MNWRFQNGCFRDYQRCFADLCSIAIIVMVLFQESKGNGLSGAIAGGEMMGNEGRSRSSNAMLAKYTKYAAIVFFVLAILVGVISIYLK